MKKILGIGNALVDVITMLPSDRLLEELALPKGSMQLVSREFSNQLLLDTAKLERKQASGGSAANTVHGLAQLGIETGFIGKIGKDPLGDFFKRELTGNSIAPFLYYGTEETGRAIALVSKDSERTFATYLGSAVDLSHKDIVPEIYEEYDMIHVEGYLVQNPELIEKVVKMAKSSNMLVSLDMASYNVVEEHYTYLHFMVKEYVDIVFANEDEVRAFTGKDPEGSLPELAEICRIAVIKLGEKGSMVQRGDEVYSIPAVNARAVDTTGAGDLYAAGFLYGMAAGLSLDFCGQAGSLLAGKVVENIGAKLTSDQWDTLRKAIRELK